MKTTKEAFTHFISDSGCILLKNLKDGKIPDSYWIMLFMYIEPAGITVRDIIKALRELDDEEDDSFRDQNHQYIAQMYQFIRSEVKRTKGFRGTMALVRKESQRRLNEFNACVKWS